MKQLQFYGAQLKESIEQKSIWRIPLRNTACFLQIKEHMDLDLKGTNDRLYMQNFEHGYLAQTRTRRKSFSTE